MPRRLQAKPPVYTVRLNLFSSGPSSDTGRDLRHNLLIRRATIAPKELPFSFLKEGIYRDSLAVLKHGDLMFDLVELSRHPAVLLVHLNTFSQRHTGGHWLQEVRERYVTSERCISLWLSKTKKIRIYIII